MSPETQTSETDFSVDNQEFGREYEPLLERDTEPFEVSEQTEPLETEPLDPITADLLDYKGGRSENWALERSGDGYTFDGEHVRDNKTGEAWQGFDADTLAQLRTNEFARLPDYEESGKLTVTYLIKGPDNSIRYEMHTTDLRERADEGSLDAFDVRPDADEYRVWNETPIATSERVEHSNDHLIEVAMAEVQQPEVIEERDEVVEMTTEQEPVAESSEPYVVERDQEHTNILSDLLMEQLPAFDVETEDVVVLKAPMSRFNLDIVRDARVENVAAREESQMTQTTGELAQASPIQKIERFPEGAIMQINRPREVVVPQQRIEVAPIAAERAVEQPVIATDRPAKEQRAPKVETQLGTKKEVRSEPEHKAETPPEKFRMRRGRERFGSEYRAPVSHRESEEALISTPRSVAETAVIRMLERFAPEAAVERREDSITNVRETPIARAEAPVLPAMRPETELPAPEQSMSRLNLDIERAENLIPFEQAKSERVVRTEIDEVLAAHGLSRTSRVEVTQVAPQEGLLSPLGRRPQLSDAANDSQQDDFITSRNGIIMRRAA